MLLERMAQELGLSEDFIRGLASSASYEYKRYTVKKKNGGLREIHHPSARLKSVQHWLLGNILIILPVHSAAMAYRTGISIFDNARLHAKGRFLLKMDLESFFPSLVKTDFLNYVQKNAADWKRWTPDDLTLASAFLFRHGKLTIGAPTSPALSNALCFELDTELTRIAANSNVRYSRYADDLFFSSVKAGLLGTLEKEVSSAIANLSIPAGLRINRLKTCHSSKKARREVAGIVLGSDGFPYVPRHYKRKIRSMTHGFDNLTEIEQASLPGMISYVVGFEPQFLNSLISKYGFEHINRVRTLLPLLDRQRIHLPKMLPGPTKRLRKSGREVLLALLREAGFDLV